eukprot:Nk52_evm5s302 gene=Nk52_evmTU5s302
MDGGDTKEEIARLRILLAEKDAEIARLRDQQHQETDQNGEMNEGKVNECDKTPTVSLDNEQIGRYSRQLMMREIAMKGQLNLVNGSVLIVGAGGLGSPAALFLCAAGVGTIGIVDYDEVELNNLHRQIIHNEDRIGVPKSLSAFKSVRKLNSSVKCIPYHVALKSDNARELIAQYDVVLDATDNVATRYLLNDACVLEGKPLVSGSALRMEGQLTTYNYQGGPCYRCLFPSPPPPETVTNCSDGGVLGVVPGIIGSFQALEAIKIIAGIGSSFCQKMALFDASSCAFRHIKLRPRNKLCASCGDVPSITELIDYEQFCGASATDKSHSLHVLSPDQRISCAAYRRAVDAGEAHFLIDVRDDLQFDICHLPNSLNIPLKEIVNGKAESRIAALLAEKSNLYFICRRGNDSQVAVQTVCDKYKSISPTGRECTVKDVKGGLTAWSRLIDPNFPTY